MISPSPNPASEVALAWPSREVVAREIRRAMLDNPTDESFNKRAEKREAIANDVADVILARFEAARTPTPAAGIREALERPVVSTKTMRLSDGGADYFVLIAVGDRKVTPHVFREEYKAAYHVALYDWLLNGTGEEPDCVEFGPDDWPAVATHPAAPLDRKALREQYARIIDPEAMSLAHKLGRPDAVLTAEMQARIRTALAKADALLALDSNDGAEGRGWQPIETAPKGVDILALEDFQREGDDGTKYPRDYQVVKKINGKWSAFGIYLESFEPTHWQPLPAPPCKPDSSS